MAKVISFSLSSASVGHAIHELEDYIDHVQKCTGELVKRLTEQGVTVASVQVAMLGAVDTGELSDSIDGYYSENTHTGFIYAGAPYAIYVEYGTGIVGSHAQHPGGEGWDVGWSYDVNGHGEAGWSYISDRDGKLHWTKGMVSRPFMYETQKELEGMCEDIFNQVFSK